jgi:hypothetical protein
MKNILALQVFDCILVEPVKFAIQICVLGIQEVSKMLV